MLESPITCSHIDVSAYGIYAIRWASAKGQLSVVELLLSDPRVDHTAGDNCAIKRASLFGHASVVELLLADSRFDKNVIESANATASNNGHSNVVKILQRVDRPEDTLVEYSIVGRAR